MESPTGHVHQATPQEEILACSIEMNRVPTLSLIGCRRMSYPTDGLPGQVRWRL